MNIERYEAKEEAKLLKALDQIFNRSNNTTEEEALLTKSLNDDDITVYNKTVDTSNCIMITALSERGKRIISRYVDHDNVPNNPALDYSNDIGDSKISTEFIIKCTAILQIDQDYIQFICGHDKPLILKTEDFEILIAPRIEEA